MNFHVLLLILQFFEFIKDYKDGLFKRLFVLVRIINRSRTLKRVHWNLRRASEILNTFLPNHNYPCSLVFSLVGR